LSRTMLLNTECKVFQKPKVDDIFVAELLRRFDLRRPLFFRLLEEGKSFGKCVRLAFEIKQAKYVRAAIKYFPNPIVPSVSIGEQFFRMIRRFSMLKEIGVQKYVDRQCFYFDKERRILDIAHYDVAFQRHDKNFLVKPDFVRRYVQLTNSPSDLESFYNSYGLLGGVEDKTYIDYILDPVMVYGRRYELELSLASMPIEIFQCVLKKLVVRLSFKCATSREKTVNVFINNGPSFNEKKMGLSFLKKYEFNKLNLEGIRSFVCSVTSPCWMNISISYSYELTVDLEQCGSSGFSSKIDDENAPVSFRSRIMIDKRKCSDERRMDRFHFFLSNLYTYPEFGVNEDFVGLDCEFAYGSKHQMILGRVSLVDCNGSILYDEYVQPSSKVQNYVTRISGLTQEKMLRGFAFSKVRSDVLDLLRGKMIIGYGLGKDLLVLKIAHLKFIDLYDLGIPKLAWTSKHYLGKAIQIGQHDSVEDSRAALFIFLKLRELYYSQIL